MHSDSRSTGPGVSRGTTQRAALALLATLTAWFGLVFADPTDLTLPGRAPLASVYGLLFLLLLLACAAYLARLRAAPLLALPLLLLWGTLQWLAHWRLVLLPPAPEHIASYNDYFGGTWRFLPASPERIVPDLYHTVLGALILLTALALIRDAVARLRRR